MKTAVTIAGFDPSGGAGLTADLVAFDRCGVRGASVVTMWTVQTRERVSRVRPLDAEFVAEQLDAVIEDSPPDAIKIGALGTAPIVRAVAARLANCEAPIVLDPVARSTGGSVPLLDEAGFEALRDELLPIATLVTPNLAETAALIGREVSTLAAMRDAAREWVESGVRAVLVKGGHLEGDAVDVLYDGDAHREFRSPRVNARRALLHGTGCRLSAAIAAGLASGLDLATAIARAKEFVERSLATS